MATINLIIAFYLRRSDVNSPPCPTSGMRLTLFIDSIFHLIAKLYLCNRREQMHRDLPRNEKIKLLSPSSTDAHVRRPFESNANHIIFPFLLIFSFFFFVLFADSELEELETTPRYRPDSISALCRATRFSEAEIKRIYRGFKAECPTGVVKEDTFKIIYSQFFPQGGSYICYSLFSPPPFSVCIFGATFWKHV